MPQTAASLESTVRLPRAVRERSARIAAMSEPPAPPPATETPPAVVPAIEEPGPSSPPAPPPPAPPADPRESDPQYWAQRFRVTQGMLDRERRDRVADQDRTDQAIAELREQLRTAQQQQPSPPSKIDLSAFFTPEQIEQYGQEQCETLTAVAVKAAREQTQAAIAEAMQPIREERERNAEQSKRVQQQAFVGALAELVPDFEAIDATDGWKLWLAQEDDATGYIRQALLDTYVRDRRADRVAKLFQAYQQTHVAPPAPPVTPSGRGGPPAAPQPAVVPALGYPTKEEIRAHYKGAAIGKKTDKEIAEFEARLQLQAPSA